MLLPIQFSTEDGVLVATFLDPRLNDELISRDIGDELLRKITEEGHKRMLLDLENVEFMSSIMVGQLMMLENKARAAGVKLVMCSVAPLIQKIFNIVRLEELIEIFPDRQSALTSFSDTDFNDFEQTNVEAAQQLLTQAQQGDAQAQYDIGLHHEMGWGVDNDLAEAFNWYRQAADQGQADAQYRLGKACAFGLHVPQDYTQALAWYQKAAEQGQVEAQYALGMSYAYGIAIEEDLAVAKHWYQKAAEQGHEKAKEELQGLA